MLVLNTCNCLPVSHLRCGEKENPDKAGMMVAGVLAVDIQIHRIRRSHQSPRKLVQVQVRRMLCRLCEISMHSMHEPRNYQLFIDKRNEKLNLNRIFKLMSLIISHIKYQPG